MRTVAAAPCRDGARAAGRWCPAAAAARRRRAARPCPAGRRARPRPGAGRARCRAAAPGRRPGRPAGVQARRTVSTPWPTTTVVVDRRQCAGERQDAVEQRPPPTAWSTLGSSASSACPCRRRERRVDGGRGVASSDRGLAALGGGVDVRADRPSRRARSVTASRLDVRASSVRRQNSRQVVLVRTMPPAGSSSGAGGEDQRELAARRIERGCATSLRRPRMTSSWIFVSSRATTTSRSPSTASGILRVATSRCGASNTTNGRAPPPAWSAIPVARRLGWVESPRKRTRSAGSPEATSAVSAALGPGTASTRMPRVGGGPDENGARVGDHGGAGVGDEGDVLAGQQSGDELPAPRSCSLCSCRLMRGVVIPKWLSSRPCAGCPRRRSPWLRAAPGGRAA